MQILTDFGYWLADGWLKRNKNRSYFGMSASLLSGL